MILISAYVSRGTGRWHPHLESRWNLQQKLRWWGRQSIQIPSSSPKCRRKQTPRIRRSDRAWRENQHASCAAKLHSNMALHLEPAENIQDEVQLSTWRANWVKNCHHVHGFYLLSPFHEFGLAFKNSRTCIYIYILYTYVCIIIMYAIYAYIYMDGYLIYIYIFTLNLYSESDSQTFNMPKNKCRQSYSSPRHRRMLLLRGAFIGSRYTGLGSCRYIKQCGGCDQKLVSTNDRSDLPA